MKDTIKFELGRHRFKTKAEASNFVKSLLAKYSIGDVIYGEDRDTLLDLLSHHPKAQTKIGDGVTSIFVQRAEMGGKCFWLRRLDDTTTEFSYLKCITHPPPDRHYMEACRNAIKDQIALARETAFGTSLEVPCPLTGTLVTRTSCHVDHSPPNEFKTLALEFARTEGLDPVSVELDGCGDGESERRFHDRDVEGRWQEFHRTHASLRVVSVWGNLSIAKRETHRLNREGR